MINKSIKRYLMFFTLGLLFLAFVLNTVFTTLIVGKQSQAVLVEKAKEQVFEMAKQAETILNAKEDSTSDLQSFVEKKQEQDNVTYAIIIDKNVQAIAHSDKEKINKVYDDAYTIEGASKGKAQFSRWYAEVQGIWTYDIMQPIYKNG